MEAVIAGAVAERNAGRRAEALAALGRLEHAGPIGHVACTIAGLVALTCAAPEAALAWLDRALAGEPRFVEALKGRATALGELRRWPEAHAAFERAFAAGCIDPVAFYHHGNALAAMGRRDDAIAAYDRALRLRPAYPEALRAGGGILRDTGNIEGALRFYRQAVTLRPGYLEAILDLADLLEREKRMAEALSTLDAGLERFPGHAQLLNNRGIVLQHMGRLDDARASLEAALAADPTLAAAHLNQGQVAVRQGRFADALQAIDQALALRPDHAESHCARGVALTMLARFPEARAAIDTALALDPSSAYARTNRGKLALLLGDFASGWPDYDFRYLTRDHDRPVLASPVPEWAGQPDPGRVVVFADQASGDVIHFARYIPVLRDAGAAVTLVCRPRLQRLLRAVTPGVRVIGAMPAAEAFDYQVPLSNMPHACRTVEATIPRAPYLRPEPDLVRHWAERLGARGFRIGLCWRGNQNWQADPKRSVPLAELRPLADVPGVRLISLQTSDNLGPDLASLQALRIETFDPDLDSGPDGFVETAAVMENLDLVVTCDTSIAHLAGALGRPTFFLLQRGPEWRFMMEREDSPWYPTMRLFRQVEQDDWATPIARLVEVVAGLAPEVAAATDR